MDIWDVLKLVGLVCLLVFVVFAFRQGQRVKPDKDNRNDRPTITGADGGPPGPNS